MRRNVANLHALRNSAGAGAALRKTAWSGIRCRKIAWTASVACRCLAQWWCRHEIWMTCDECDSMLFSLVVYIAESTSVACQQEIRVVRSLQLQEGYQ